MISYGIGVNSSSGFSLPNSIVDNNLITFGVYIKPSANDGNKKKVMLTLFRMGIFEVAHGWGTGAKRIPPLSKIFDTSFNDDIDAVSKFLEKIKKKWITWHTPWFLLTLVFFHQKSANIVISRSKDTCCFSRHNL